MNPEAVRQRILEEHRRLRSLLDHLVPLAERFEAGEESVGVALREAAHALYEVFGAHLEHEERALEPLLRARGAEGDRLADRLAHEHREQRALLSYLTGRLRQDQTPTVLVAREVRSFVEYVRLDMVHEESTLLSAAVVPEE